MFPMHSHDENVGLSPSEREEFDNMTGDKLAGMTDPDELRRLEKYMREQQIFATADAARKRLHELGSAPGQGQGQTRTEQVDELRNVKENLHAFLSEVAAKDSKLAHASRRSSALADEVPVRGQAAGRPGAAANGSAAADASARILVSAAKPSSGAAPKVSEYYDKWDAKASAAEAEAERDAQKENTPIQRSSTSPRRDPAHAAPGPASRDSRASEASLEAEIRAEQEKLKGNDFFKAREFDKAVVAYTRAIALRGDCAAFYANRAAAFLALKRFEDAEMDCNKAIVLQPGYDKALLRRANARVELDNPREALEDLETAQRLKPELASTKDVKQLQERIEALLAKANARRIPIEETDGESDEETDEDVPPAVASSNPSPANHVAAQKPGSAQHSVPSTLGKILVEDSSDDSDDSDADTYPSAGANSAVSSGKRNVPAAAAGGKEGTHSTAAELSTNRTKAPGITAQGLKVSEQPGGWQRIDEDSDSSGEHGSRSTAAGTSQPAVPAVPAAQPGATPAAAALPTGSANAATASGLAEDLSQLQPRTREIMERLGVGAAAGPADAGHAEDAALQELPEPPSKQAERLKEEGNALFRARQHQQAIATFTRAIALDPINAALYANRATAKFQLKDFAGVELDATVAVQLDPSYAGAYRRRSQGRRERGYLEGAYADLQRARDVAEPKYHSHLQQELDALQEAMCRKAERAQQEAEQAQRDSVFQYKGGVVVEELDDSEERAAQGFANAAAEVEAEATRLVNKAHAQAAEVVRAHAAKCAGISAQNQAIKRRNDGLAAARHAAALEAARRMREEAIAAHQPATAAASSIETASEPSAADAESRVNQAAAATASTAVEPGSRCRPVKSAAAPAAPELSQASAESSLELISSADAEEQAGQGHTQSSAGASSGMGDSAEQDSAARKPVPASVSAESSAELVDAPQAATADHKSAPSGMSAETSAEMVGPPQKAVADDRFVPAGMSPESSAELVSHADADSETSPALGKAAATAATPPVSQPDHASSTAKQPAVASAPLESDTAASTAQAPVSSTAHRSKPVQRHRVIVVEEDSSDDEADSNSSFVRQRSGTVLLSSAPLAPPATTASQPAVTGTAADGLAATPGQPTVHSPKTAPSTKGAGGSDACGAAHAAAATAQADANTDTDAATAQLDANAAGLAAEAGHRHSSSGDSVRSTDSDDNGWVKVADAAESLPRAAATSGSPAADQAATAATAAPSTATATPPPAAVSASPAQDKAAPAAATAAAAAGAPKTATTPVSPQGSHAASSPGVAGRKTTLGKRSKAPSRGPSDDGSEASEPGQHLPPAQVDYAAIQAAIAAVEAKAANPNPSVNVKKAPRKSKQAKTAPASAPAVARAAATAAGKAGGAPGQPAAQIKTVLDALGPAGADTAEKIEQLLNIFRQGQPEGSDDGSREFHNQLEQLKKLAAAAGMEAPPPTAGPEPSKLGQSPAAGGSSTAVTGANTTGSKAGGAKPAGKLSYKQAMAAKRADAAKRERAAAEARSATAGAGAAAAMAAAVKSGALEQGSATATDTAAMSAAAAAGEQPADMDASCSTAQATTRSDQVALSTANASPKGGGDARQHSTARTACASASGNAFGNALKAKLAAKAQGTVRDAPAVAPADQTQHAGPPSAAEPPSIASSTAMAQPAPKASPAGPAAASEVEAAQALTQLTAQLNQEMPGVAWQQELERAIAEGQAQLGESGTAADSKAAAEASVAALTAEIEAVQEEIPPADRERLAGNVLFKANRISEALAHYGRACELDPDSALAWANRASAVERLGQYAAALEFASKAVQLDPSYVKARRRQAIALQRLGELQGARMAYIQLLNMVSGAEQRQIAAELDSLERDIVYGEEQARTAAAAAAASAGEPGSTSASSAGSGSAGAGHRLIVEDVSDDEHEGDDQRSGTSQQHAWTYLDEPASVGHGHLSTERRTAEGTSGSTDATMGPADSSCHGMAATAASPADRMSSQPSQQPAAATSPPPAAPAASSLSSDTATGAARSSSSAASADGAAATLPPGAAAAGASATAAKRATSSAPGDAAATAKVAARGPRTPASAWDFERQCRQLDKDPAALSQYVRSIPPAQYQATFKSQLSPGILAKMLQGLQVAAQEGEVQFCSQALQALSGVERFQINCALMNKSDKQGFVELLDRLQLEHAQDVGGVRKASRL